MRKIGVIFLFLLIATLPIACNKSANDNSATATTSADDARIKSAVKDKIAQDPALQDANIDVDADNAVVALNGTVKTEGQEQKAIELAQNVSGVRTVRSFLRQESETAGAGSTGTSDQGMGSSLTEDAKDAQITAKVKLELAKADNVSATAVHVDTKDGVVTLSGEVKSRSEIESAIRIARGVDDVKSVRSDLIVKRSS